MNVEAYEHMYTKAFVYFYRMTSIMQLHCAGDRPSVLLDIQGETPVCHEGSRAGHMGEMANNRE